MVPVIVFFAVFIGAVLLAILSVRTSMSVVLLLLPVLYIIVFILIRLPITAGVIISSFYLSGITVGYALKKRLDFRSTFVAASGAYLFFMIATVVIFNRLEGVNQIDKFILNPFQQYLIQVEQSMGNALKLYGDPEIYEDRFQVIQQGFVLLKDMVSILIPALFIISSAALGFITLSLSRFILKRMGYNYKYLPSFYELKASKGTTGVFALSLILSMVIGNQVVSAALINITFILFVVLSVCGLAVFDFFVHRVGIHVILRIIIYVVILGGLGLLALIFPILHPTNVLIIAALADSIFNFRKLKKKGEHNG